MLMRRIRGLLVAATLWAAALSCTVIIFTSLFFLGSADHESIREFASELADLLPMSLSLGGLAGLLFGLLIVFAERGQTLRSMSERRFRIWGAVAAALSMAIVEGVTVSGRPHGLLMRAAYSILTSGFAGASLAESMLHAARRADPAEGPSLRSG